MDLPSLLDELARAPHLEGAACRGHANLFDGSNAAAAQVAKAVCEFECPALAACRNYLHASPFPMSGVVAGERIRPPRHGHGFADWIAERSTQQRRRDGTRRAAAARWLREQLAAGPMTSDEVASAGAKVGYDRHLLFVARKRIGAVAVHREGCGRHTLWALTQADTMSALAACRRGSRPAQVTESTAL